MTAVEWLVDQLQKAEYIPKDSIITDYVINLSKEMEKQQMEDAYKKGKKSSIKTFIEYYKEL